MGAKASCQNTTHDWSAAVDHEHLAKIRQSPSEYAPGGLLHLVLEVLAYAADEAQASGRTGWAEVRVHADGSVSVTDDGRGTDTRFERNGQMIKKPVMATPDLRFFDEASRVVLPDGSPRRGMSVVAALSQWLIHINRRLNGSWTQRYENGVPITNLVPIPGDGSTGTTVRFQPDASLAAEFGDDPLQQLVGNRTFVPLCIDVRRDPPN